jgi:hypothetical protein
MLFSALFSLLVASTVVAQTPPGFFPNTTTNLVVKFGSKTLTPGQSLGKAGRLTSSSKRVGTNLHQDTGKAPILGTTEGPLNGTFIFVMIGEPLIQPLLKAKLTYMVIDIDLCVS